MASSDTQRFKIVLLGDGGTGKTSFLRRFTTGHFEHKYIATLGHEVHHLLFNTNYGTVLLDCWDTAGQEMFGFAERCCHNTDGAVLFFDLGSKTTYKNLPKWHQKLLQVTGPIPLVVCGNKMDRPARTVLHIKVHQQWPDTAYYDVSAKSNYYYEKPFLSLLRRLMGKPDLQFVSVDEL